MDAAAEQVVMENIEQHGHDYTPEQFLHAKRVEKPVMIAKIDCVLHLEFCRSQRIRAYPTLRFYIDGEFDQDYRGHRTVVEMADWLTAKEQEHKEDLQRDTNKVQKAAEAARKRMDVSAEEKEWEEKVKMHRHRNNRRIWNAEDHPGCQMSGHLMLDRVPGNFHIQARSANHDLVPHMTNVSHVVNSLTIGEPMVQRMIETNHVFVPDDVKSKFSPMNGNVYVTNALHEAYHHYLKVITTNFEGVPKVANYKRNLKAYQLLQNSQLSYYRNDVVPEAKFIYDLSPISVKYEKRGRHWYDYLTSLMAIIGGTFTMVGMVESGINAAVHRKRRYR